MSKKIDLPYDELCNLISNNVRRSTPNSVDFYLKGIYRTILRQLELNQKIYFKDFGTFEIKMRKGSQKMINNPKDNTKQIYDIRPKYIISFTPSKVFDYSVNENNFKRVNRLKTAENVEKNKPPKKKPKKYYKRNIVGLLNKANAVQEKGLIGNGEKLIYRTKINKSSRNIREN